MSFSFVDVAVVLIIIVSTGYATYRGFVSETLSIFAWAAAAFAALWFGPWVVYLLHGVISPAWLGLLVGYAAVFLAVLIPLSFMSFRFSQGVKKSPVSALDGALGGAFGVVRGLAVIGIAYLIFSMIIPIPSQPAWITNARLLPLIRGSAQVVASLIPDQHVSEHRDIAERPAVMPHANPVIHQKSAKVTPVHTAKTPKKHVKKAYGAKDRHALDKLIEATDSNGSGKP
jgi:membrane protein required for colicin V production